MKIEITLKNYNKLKAKEEILNQLVSATNSAPSSDFTSLNSAYKKLQSIIESSEDIVISEFKDFEEIKVKMSRKVYDFYLSVQMYYSQIENLSCSSPNATDSLILYWNTLVSFIRAYKKVLDKKSSEIEEFNTLVKIEKENRILKKRNEEMELHLRSLSENDESDNLYDFE